MSLRIIKLMSSAPSVTVGAFEGAFYENNSNHYFEWDGKGSIYLSRVSNSVAKVSTGTGTAVLNAGNNRKYSWQGRCGIYDVTYLWSNNGDINRYIDFARYAMPGETLTRQSVYLIISVGGIFCPVNMDIA